MEAQISTTDVYQGLAWAFVLIYLVATLPGKFQRAVYLWRLRYWQQMSTKVWPSAIVLNYLVPTLPGKIQRAVYSRKLRYRQLMSTKVWPGLLCWTSWFLLCLVSFREQYTYGGSHTDKDVYQRMTWALLLNYLVPILPGKFQRAVDL